MEDRKSPSKFLKFESLGFVGVQQIKYLKTHVQSYRQYKKSVGMHFWLIPLSKQYRQINAIARSSTSKHGVVARE